MMLSRSAPSISLQQTPHGAACVASVTHVPARLCSARHTCLDLRPLLQRVAASSRQLTVAAAAEVTDAPAAAAAAVVAEQQQPQEEQPANQQQQQKQRRSSSSRPAQGGDDATKPIVVVDKPVTKALIKRLEKVPQLVVRAGRPGEPKITYRALSSLAAAQRALEAASPGKVLVYVPWTQWRTGFTANVLPADRGVMTPGPGTPTLTVSGATQPAQLAATLAFELLRSGSVRLQAAGVAASCVAAEAARLARVQLLPKGYELGVMPVFVDGKDKAGGEMTVLDQVVVAQQLEPPQIIAPRSARKSLAAAVTAGSKALLQQGRLSIKAPGSSRLTELLVALQQQLAAGGGGRQRQQQKQQQQQQQQQPNAEKQRLLMLSVDGSTSLFSSSNSSKAAAGQAAAAGGDAGDAVPYFNLQAFRSRLTVVPDPKLGLAGPTGTKDDRKVVFSSAASSVAGLAGAIESKVARVGAAWLTTDGSAAGNAAAWDSVVAAARKVCAWDGQGGLLVLVDAVQEAAAAAAPAAADTGAEEPAAAAPSKCRLQMLLFRDDDVPRSLLQAPNTPLETTGVSPQPALALLKFAAAANMFMPLSPETGAGGLVILPAVLASASSNKQQGGAAAAAAAADSPAAAAAALGGGAGGSEAPASDYRFAGEGSQLPLGFNYAFRVQRCTQGLDGGVSGPDVAVLRVSNSTDAGKLRDAIVAKVLQGQPAALRFIATSEAVPPTLFGTAMTAVAAARVRLQQKRSGLDVGVMPLAESLAQAGLAEAGAGSGDAAAKGTASSAPGPSKRQRSRTLYSLRLVPMPVSLAAAAEALGAE